MKHMITPSRHTNALYLEANNMHPTSWLLFITIVFQISLSDAGQYLTCSKPFRCVGMENLSYPFWGQNPPQYCGHPGYELNCSGDAPEITIGEIKYRIFDFIPESQAINVARADFRDNFCPKYLLNTTLDFNLFDYTSTSQNMTLYYGCPSTPNPTPETGFSNFSCTINTTNITGFYVTTTNFTETTRCSSSVTVPVFKTAVHSRANLTVLLNNGFALKWTANNTSCQQCTRSGGQCGSSPGSGEFTCYCPYGPTQFTCTQTGRNFNIIFVWITIGVAGIIGAAIFLILKVHAICMKKMETDHDIEASIVNCGSLTLKRYSYSDVVRITNSFKHKLGQGGYGGVYKGQLQDGRAVAVKVLSESRGNGEEFINEVASISKTSHVNVVTLLGFCYKRKKRALIYEFMPNGSLDNFIYERVGFLKWKTLYQIAVGIARGLEYLHQGCNTRILHLDIKPQNFLLDKEFCPKISDFGLAKLCQNKDSIISLLGARGTAGYIAPEVFSRNFGGVSHKSDVYSYGMMVLEMVGGRNKIEIQGSGTSEISSPHWIYNLGMDLRVLDDIMTEEEEEISRKLVLVSRWCIQTIPSDRPSMGKVLEMLEGRLQVLPVPPKPFMFFPPRLDPQHSSSTSLS